MTPKKLLKKLLGNEFIVNVAKLVSGTSIAQLIPLLIAPVLTRLYSPDDFTSLEQFLMLVEILIVPATLKYEFAIMQPEKDGDARQLLYFVLGYCFLASLVYTALGYFFAKPVADLLNNPAAVEFLPWIGLGVFLLGAHFAFNYWFSRKKRYGLLASNKVIETSVAEGSKVGLGGMGMSTVGLVGGFLAGRVAMALAYGIRYVKGLGSNKIAVRKSELKPLLKTYSEYPRYTTLSSIFGRTTAWLHVFLFSMYFFPMVGFIAIVRRLAFAPLNIISQSYSQVFYQKISEVSDAGKLMKIYDASLRPLILIAISLIVVVYLLPEGTFGYILGEEYAEAQLYLEILVFWFSANFVSSSVSFIMLRLKKQREMVKLDVAHFVLVLGSIYIPLGMDMTGIQTLITFAAAQTGFYVFMILLGRHYVKEYAKENFPT